MSEINVGDSVVITAAAPESEAYPWVRTGLEGVVTEVAHKYKDYQYSVKFEGEFPVIFSTFGRGQTMETNPTLLFDRSEIELKEG